jgi:uncharacterized protein YbjQ (UPF0145 family)
MPDCPECGTYVQVGSRSCPSCGYETDFDALAARQRTERARAMGLDDEGAQETERKRREALARAEAVIVSSLPTVPGREIREAVTVVSAETGPLTSVVGTLFGISEETFAANWRDAKQAAFMRLRQQAIAAGCDAIVGLEMRVTGIGGGQSSTPSVMMLLYGTAVRLVEPVDAGHDRSRSSHRKPLTSDTDQLPPTPRW